MSTIESPRTHHVRASRARRAPLRALLAAGVLCAVFSGCGTTLRNRGGADFDPLYRDWNTVLARHATVEGVNYAALAHERATLDCAVEALQALERAEFEAWPRERRLAFLINAHNIFAVRRIVDRWPLGSVFARQRWRWMRGYDRIELIGERWDLFELADEVTGDEYLRARALFLLNWGEAGCAPLPTVAVTDANLHALIARQTQRLFTNPATFRYDKDDAVIRVTPLIQRYRAPIERDFTTIRIFIENHVPPDDARTMRNRPPRIRYLEFDHALNLDRTP